MHVVAFSLFFFPYGGALAIGADCISELQALYVTVVGDKRKSLFPRFDVTIPSNANTILELSEENKNDLSFIKERRAVMVRNLEETLPKVGGLIRTSLELKIEDINVAYATLEKYLQRSDK